MSKQTVGRVLKAVCFLLLIVLLTAVLSYYTQPANNKDLWPSHSASVLAEPENTLDCLLIGSSNITAGTSPMEMWSTYGFTSQITGEPWAHLPLVYYRFCDILKKQSPRVLVVDTDVFFDRKASCTIAEETLNKSLGELASVYVHHDNWKLWGTEKNTTPFRDPFHGQNVYTYIEGYTGKGLSSAQHSPGKLRLTYRLFWSLILKKCRDSGVTPVLVSIPCPKDWSDARHNTIQALADSTGVSYLDFNSLSSDIQFDPSSDFRDGGTHLNAKGAKKVSGYLGRFLAGHASLPDHRKDAAFASWNEDLALYTDTYTTAYGTEQG